MAPDFGASQSHHAHLLLVLVLVLVLDCLGERRPLFRYENEYEQEYEYEYDSVAVPTTPAALPACLAGPRILVG
jgi:hypothetical protein